MTVQNKIVAELEKAYRTEIAGHLFYLTAADMVSNERGKNVFNHLAKEELQHIGVISSIAESVKNGRGWISYDEAVRGAGRVPHEPLPIFPGRDVLVMRLKENETDVNAIKIGIESEEAAVEFYSNLLKSATVTDEKVALTRLLEMEKGHLKMLRWEGESLMNTGFWSGTMEYSVEKETD